MQLEEVILHNFKGFKNYTLKLKQFNVLIGENNSGKTSLLQAIQLVYGSIHILFGGGEHPRFTNISWRVNLAQPISRLGLSNSELIFFKKVPEGLQMSAKWDNGLQLNFNAIQKDIFDFELLEKDISINDKLNDPRIQELITSVYSTKAVMLPPVGTISPTEDIISFPQMENLLSQGRYNETWRGNLFWTYNSGDKTTFDEVSEFIRAHIPDSDVLPPRLSGDNPAKFIIEYSDGSDIYDISSSGGGLRTLISLAMILKLAEASCILIDEPDTHLHSGLQREIAEILLEHTESQNIQMVIATHSPDIIDSVPLDSLLFIDRSRNEPLTPEGVGSVLVSLGAMTNSEALAMQATVISGASTIINIEGKTDKTVLSRFAEKNNEAFPPTPEAELVRAGKKGMFELKHIHRGMSDFFKINIKIAQINDRDYDTLIHEEEGIKKEEDEGVLLLTLGKKEIENYLLDANGILKAVKFQIQKTHTKYNESLLPDIDSIRSIINDSLEEHKKALSYHLKHLIRDELPKGWNDATKEKEAEEKFEKLWANEKWRISVCPGKSVLGSVRTGIQKRWKVSVTNHLICKYIEPIPEDIESILVKLKDFLKAEGEG